MAEFSPLQRRRPASRCLLGAWPSICHIGGIANPEGMPWRLYSSVSGDLIADRRYELARGYEARRRSGGRRRSVRAGGGTRARLCLGVVCARRACARSWAICTAPSRRSSRHARPTRRIATAPALHLARLGAADAATAMPRSLCAHAVRPVRAALRPRARRTCPIARRRLLRDAVEAHAGGQRTLQFGTMLDLGCGTGLAGAAFRPHVDWLVGVDLSAG